MPRGTAWPGLACLDRRFVAEFSGDEIDRQFPGGISDDLIRGGVLADAGIASEIGRCVCDLRRPECVSRVDVKGGKYWSMCSEYGLPVEVSRAQVQRYRFNWKAWADWLRRNNALGGPGPTMGAGTLFVGSGSVGGREYGLIVVAPGCLRAEDVVLPEGARRRERSLVALALGEPMDDLSADAVVPIEALGQDLTTLDVAALERAVAPKESADNASRWTGPPLTAKEAASRLGSDSGPALLKAVRPERVHEGDPLYILRQHGPGRTPGGKFREDAVAHVKGLLGKAGREYDAGVGKRIEQARAAKAATPPPDRAATERRLLQRLARQEKKKP